jgi:hypothetical protein
MVNKRQLWIFGHHELDQRTDGGARETPIWKLEAALKCRSRKKGRYAPPAHCPISTPTHCKKKSDYRAADSRSAATAEPTAFE